MNSYGQKLRDARKAKGYSLDEVAFRVRSQLHRPVTGRKIGRLEDGTTSAHGADAPLFVLLCQTYEVDPWTISPEITERAEADRLALAAWGGGGRSPRPERRGLAGEPGGADTNTTTNSYARRATDQRERRVA
jgi:transcriptional regulator with XRE-family HTH domain